MSSSSDYLEQLENFYKLKHKYDLQLQKMKQKIIANPTLNKKQKRDKFLLLKPKCINCKKPVGTIFTTDNKEAKAICGASEIPGSGFKPCSLNIDIKKPQFQDLDHYVSQLEKHKQKVMDQIIQIKLNLLFNYISEDDAVTQFDEKRKDYSEVSSEYETYLSSLVEITQLLNKKEEINTTDLQIFELVKQIKELIKKGKDERNEQFIKDAVDIYINKLLDVLQSNMDLKYSYKAVEQHGDEFNLIQIPYTLQDLTIEIK